MRPILTYVQLLHYALILTHRFNSHILVQLSHTIKLSAFGHFLTYRSNYHIMSNSIIREQL